MASVLIILNFCNVIINDLVNHKYIVYLGTTAELSRDMYLKVLVKPDLI